MKRGCGLAQRSGLSPVPGEWPTPGRIRPAALYKWEVE
jgi:hypothetical protein